MLAQCAIERGLSSSQPCAKVNAANTTTSAGMGGGCRELTASEANWNGTTAEARFAARHELAKRCESASKIQAVKAIISTGRLVLDKNSDMVGIEAGCADRLEGMSLAR